MAGRHKNGVLTEYSLQDEGELAVVKAADAITYQKNTVTERRILFFITFFLLRLITQLGSPRRSTTACLCFAPTGAGGRPTSPSASLPGHRADRDPAPCGLHAPLGTPRPDRPPVREQAAPAGRGEAAGASVSKAPGGARSDREHE